MKPLSPRVKLTGVRLYRRTREGFDRAMELSREAGDVLATPLMPGLALPLTRLLRD